MREKATHYKSSNFITINYLISLGYTFSEEVVKNIYDGKTSFIFSFSNNQKDINKAIDYVKKCRETGEKLFFPEKHTEKQMTFKEANKIRWVAIEMCYPELRDR